jgi:hypothetical protein
MPRGQSSGHRALAHLLATLSIATTKASKRANLPARDKRRIDNGQLKYFGTIEQNR